MDWRYSSRMITMLAVRSEIGPARKMIRFSRSMSSIDISR